MKKVILTIIFSLLMITLVFSDDSSEKIAKANELVDDLSAGKYSECILLFDNAMKAALPADKLELTWKTIIMQVGSLKVKTAVRKEEKGKYTIVYVTCQFEKALLDTKVVFEKDNLVTGLFFVPANQAANYKLPAYAKPDSFIETEVTVGSGEWKLPGTLALPNGAWPFPAVILIHGSGPEDRDETIGPNKPFKDIASGLASNGIAVLRYEKRTKVYGQKMSKSITLKEEITDDVLFALELLRQTDKIDKKRIFLLGHSLGGMTIPRLGTLDKNTAGLIILAGNTRPLEDLLVEQIKYIFSLNKEMSQKDKVSQLAALLQQTDKIKKKDYDLNTPASELPLGLPPAYWQDLQKYNQLETAKGLTQPLYILQGERDYQVTKVDFEGWQIGLKGKSNVEYKLYPKLNHLFMEGKGKATPEEYGLEGHVSEYVVKDITNWINKIK